MNDLTRTLRFPLAPDDVLTFIHIPKTGGISLIAVRKAYAALRRYLNTQHPFSHQDLLTDGRKLFVYLEQESQNRAELIEVVSQQHAIPHVLMPYLQRVDYFRHRRLQCSVAHL